MQLWWPSTREMYSGPRDLSENKPHPSLLKPAPPSNAQMEETKQSELTAVSEVVSSQAHTKGNEVSTTYILILLLFCLLCSW